MNKVKVSLLVDEDTVHPWGIFPKRIFARCSPDSASESGEYIEKKLFYLRATTIAPR